MTTHKGGFHAHTAEDYREDADRIWREFGYDIFGLRAPKTRRATREYDADRFRHISQSTSSEFERGRQNVKDSMDLAFAYGRDGQAAPKGAALDRALPDGLRPGERSLMRQEWRAGVAVHRVDNAPVALRSMLSVERDRLGAPILRLSGVGKGWRNAPEKPYRDLIDKVIATKVAERDAGKRRARSAKTADARERGRDRATAAQAIIEQLREAKRTKRVRDE